jgi:hypothetical protein
MSKRLTPEQKRINWAVRRLLNMHKAAEADAAHHHRDAEVDNTVSI